MSQSISRGVEPQISSQFIMERARIAEDAASRFGMVEGLILAALADGDDDEIKAALGMSLEAVAGLLSSLLRYSRA